MSNKPFTNLILSTAMQAPKFPRNNYIEPTPKILLWIALFISDGTGYPGYGSPGYWVSDFDRVGSRVSVSEPVFDPALSFNMRVYRGVVSTE